MITTVFEMEEFICDALAQEQEPGDITRGLIANGLKLPVVPKLPHTCADSIGEDDGDNQFTNDAYGNYRICPECGTFTNPQGGEL